MSFSQREKDYTECQIPFPFCYPWSLQASLLSFMSLSPLIEALPTCSPGHAQIDVHCSSEQFNDSQHLVNAWLYHSCLRSEAVTLENTICSISSSSLGPYSETTCLRASQEIIPALLRLAFGNLVSRMFVGKRCISRPSQSD